LGRSWSWSRRTRAPHAPRGDRLNATVLRRTNSHCLKGTRRERIPDRDGNTRWDGVRDLRRIAQDAIRVSLARLERREVGSYGRGAGGHAQYCSRGDNDAWGVGEIAVPVDGVA